MAGADLRWLEYSRLTASPTLGSSSLSQSSFKPRCTQYQTLTNRCIPYILRPIHSYLSMVSLLITEPLAFSLLEILLAG